MSVIFVGFIYPTGKIDELKEMGSSIDFAAETFQYSLLQGLCKYHPDLKVITAPNISAFPQIKKLVFSSSEFFLPFSGCRHFFTGFLNIPGIKHVSKYLRVRKAIRESLDRNSNNTIIVYGVHSPFLMALCGINRCFYKSCLIVPDLPEFMSSNSNLFYLLGKKIDKWFIRIGLKMIDSFALFSPYMKDRINIGDKPWTQIEGIFCDDVYIEKVEKDKHKTILYSGSLDKRYGIMDLLEAFNRIEDSKYRLWICGGGDALEEIMKRQQDDSRIQYLGLLSKEKVRTLQKKATILINPRHSADEYTKYSFPSKTMEYMASGTPTLMAHLASIPREYESHLFFFDDESIEGMKNKIIEVCEKPQWELDEFGKFASEFILREKNEKIQAKKIVDILQGLHLFPNDKVGDCNQVNSML